MRFSVVKPELQAKRLYVQFRRNPTRNYNGLVLYNLLNYKKFLKRKVARLFAL